MKALLLVGLMASSLAFAQAKKDAEPADKAHIEMHEKMAKAHQQAADCLKSGKPADECREAFKASCKDSGEPGHCGMMGGPGMGHMKKRGK